MASQGPLFPSVAVSTSVAPESDNAWDNPGNVVSDDGTEASVTAASFDAGDNTTQLVTSGYGFTIPAGATIDGIVVEVQRRTFAGAGEDFRIQLRDASGALVGDNKADTVTAWPGTATTRSYGGVSDTWTASPTVAMVNDADFGVVVSAMATAANTDIGVDFIRITVYYTEAAETDSTGSGSPVTTLSETADGDATQRIPGSGSPVSSLDETADGDATQTIPGSGSPVAALDETADGTATNTGPPSDDVTGSGAPVTSLDETADGDAVQTVPGSGAPITTLSETADGAGTQTIPGSGAPVTSLDPTASGDGTNTPPPPEPITASGAATTSLRAFVTGTVSNPNSPVVRRTRGFWIIDEREKEPEEQPVVAAKPLRATETEDPPELRAELPVSNAWRALPSIITAKNSITAKNTSVAQDAQQDTDRQRRKKQQSQLIQLIKAGAA